MFWHAMIVQDCTFVKLARLELIQKAVWVSAESYDGAVMCEAQKLSI